MVAVGKMQFYMMFVVPAIAGVVAMLQEVAGLVTFLGVQGHVYEVRLLDYDAHFGLPRVKNVVLVGHLNVLEILMAVEVEVDEFAQADQGEQEGVGQEDHVGISEDHRADLSEAVQQVEPAELEETVGAEALDGIGD